MTPQQRLEIGLSHHRAGNLRQAEAIYRQLLAEQPNFGDALQLLGALAAQVGRYDDAINLLKQAIAARPDVGLYYGNLGAIYQTLSRFDEAIPLLQRSIDLDPNRAEAYHNLGSILVDRGDTEHAVELLRKGIALHPSCAEIHNCTGLALRSIGKYDEAIRALRQAIALKPAYADAHWMLALVFLVTGDFAAGWTEYEWRKQIPTLYIPRNFPGPPWNGDRLDGKTILLHAEQGMGDTLQFIRYVPMVLQRGARIVVECPPELAKVLRGIEGIAEIYTQGQKLPPFDAHCSIMSLPMTLGTTLQTIPTDIPYLNVPADVVAAWRQRIDPADRRRRVGLVWAGNSQHAVDRHRSIKLEQLAPLAEMKSTRFFSLQKGLPAAQATTPPPGLEMVNWTDDLNDFVETAALIANLDLLICVDTAVAHLAGAMGKPVWLLLPFVPDWRWMLNRSDTPWYPSMRLFRQRRPGDWEQVITELAFAMGELPPRGQG